MKLSYYIQILILSIFIPVLCQSQNAAKKRANKFYNNFQFNKAIEIYEALHEKNPSDSYLFQRLAYAYNKIGDYENASTYYSSLVESDIATAEDFYQYSQLLKVEGNYNKAQNWLEKYLAEVPNDELAKKQLSKLPQLTNGSNPMIFSVRRVSKNTRFTDMCPVIHKGKLIFSSSRDTFSVTGNNYSWDGQPLLDLYSAGFHKRSLYEIEKFSKELNSRFHEGPFVFSKDGNTIYFTRNNYTGGKKKRTSDGKSNLKIFISEWDGKRWKKEKEFPYNSDEYSVGHPALSTDGQTLYFISDMPGGFGKTDIYKSNWTPQGWSQPINLGAEINTREKEMFPTVDTNDNIFFSSNGLPGYGGLDIFVALNGNNGIYPVHNLGNTLNSTYDDFSLTFDETNTSGYFTSNRVGSIGGDDIYYFDLEGVKIEIVTKDQDTNNPLPLTMVELQTNNEFYTRKNSDNNGGITLDVKIGEEYILRGLKKGYRTIFDKIKPNYSENPIRKELLLKPIN